MESFESQLRSIYSEAMLNEKKRYLREVRKTYALGVVGLLILMSPSLILWLAG